MLKLTRVRPSGPILVAPSAIAMIERDGVGGSFLQLTISRGVEIQVRETPDEIMALEPMVRHLNPLVALPPPQLPLTVTSAVAPCPLGNAHCPNGTATILGAFPASQGPR